MARYDKPVRFSVVARSFTQAIVAMGPTVTQQAYVGAVASIGPAKGEGRVADDGRTYEQRDVNSASLTAAVPSEFRVEARDLQNVLEAEMVRRGALWRREGAAVAFTNHVIEPLRAALDKFRASPAVDSGSLAATVRDLVARVAALEAVKVAAPAPQENAPA